MINTITDILTNTQSLPLTLSHNWEIIKGQTLHWKQPKRLQGEYLLQSQDHTWGILQCDENHFIRRANVKTAAEEWRFKYTRFSLPKVTIQIKNNLVAQAIIETNWGWRGTLILADNLRYTWKTTGYTEDEFCFLTKDNHPVLFIRPRTGLLKLEAEVEIDPAILHNPHLPLLATLSWFLVLLRMS
jgi:hypothetical protein